MNRPNVLLIWTDQQRWDTIGAAGNPIVQTPYLDQLARAGTLFDHAFANCPVCMPSRQSLLSGRYPGTLGVRSNGIEMREDVQCIQHVLSGYGYHTAQLGKLHFLNHASPYRDHREPHPRYGFDTCIVSDEPGCYDDPYIEWVRAHDPKAVDLCRVDTPPAWTGTPVRVHPRNTHQPYVFQGPEHLTHSAFVADITCDYLRNRAHRAREGEPFFAVAGFYAPHAPLNPPPRFLDRYNVNDMPLPARAEGENFVDPDTGVPVTDAQWKIIRQHYYALISHVDECVGRILRTLDELDLTDDTIVIFTSDHAENLGDHGLIQKTQSYDSSARVPLIVKPPATLEGDSGAVPTTGNDGPELRRAHGFAELVDLAPTIMEYCGIPVPPFFQGRSLRPAIASASPSGTPAVAEGAVADGAAGRTNAFIEHGVPGGPGYKAVRTNRYLYTRFRDGRESLHDLRNDPHQLRAIDGEDADPALLSEARGLLLERIIDSDPAYPKRTADY